MLVLPQHADADEGEVKELLGAFERGAAFGLATKPQ